MALAALSDRIVSARDHLMSTATVRKDHDWVGRVIDGRFTLLQWLGGSESSNVFLTELPENPSEKAAIKLVLADTVDADAHIAGWAATTALSHPHLIRLFHTGRCQINSAMVLYAVMEYAEENLSQVIPERPLTPAEAREMLPPVLDALSFLHEKGFVHGHLKPSNIMVVDNQLKVCWDRRHVADRLRKPLPALGAYDAPELASGTISPAADVWSLGVTLVEALTQKASVWDPTPKDDPALPGYIPQPFADIARECLRIDLTRRCTAGDVKDHLDPVRPFASPVKKASETRTGKFPLTALVAAALVLLVIFGLKLRHHQSQPGPEIETPQAEPATVAPTPQTSEISKGAPGKGAIAQRVQPEVSRNASKTIQGRVKVKVRLTVGPNGSVSNAAFDSSGPSKYFASLALQAARQWKFKPPLVDGQAVPSVWILQFQFGRDGTDITSVEVSP
jgi:TonB family protein